MSFHLFQINELYSNANGAIQFIELTIGNINGESFWQGQSIDVIQGNAVHSFRFTTNLPNPNTANKSVLIATQGFADLNFITPDHIVPDGFLFTSGSATVNFADADAIAYTNLPINGVHSIDRNGTIQVNSPKNFAGVTGTVPSNTILGTSGPDQLVGTNADNTIEAGDGNDRLNGLLGNDLLNGGTGIDTAIYSDNSSAYTINSTKDGISISGPEGSDTLINTERLDFQNKKWIWQLPMFLRKTAGSLAALVKPGIIGEKYKQLMELPSAAVKDTFPVSRQISLPESIQRLLNVPAKEDAVASIVGNVLEGNEQLGVLSQVSAAEISTYMQNILLRDTDQMSMASALEVRVPFLDYELVEYVMGIKDEFKNPLFPKKLLVDSMGDLLPDEIVHRKKMGFTFPWQHWLKNELKEFCNERIQSLSKRNFMNGKEVIDRWNRFLQGDPGIRWPDIWICVVLENWLLENQIEN